MADDIAESFGSALNDLTCNSKPHINMLTMLAEDHMEFAPLITQTVVSHLKKVRSEVKLPTLYLIDSIIKNVGKDYINLFNNHIADCFVNTFEEVDEKTREQMYKLRMTWSDIFSPKMLNLLDAKVKVIDPAWPVTFPKAIYVNPKFFPVGSSSSTGSSVVINPPSEESIRNQKAVKQRMLLELKQKKLKMQLKETQKKLEEQQKKMIPTKTMTKTKELLTLEDSINEEREKIRLMTKDLKKVKSKLPNLQEIHRVTCDMKAQTLMEPVMLPPGVESLVKPAALLELAVPAKPAVKSVVTKTRPTSATVPKPAPNPALGIGRKQIVAADSTDEIVPPVRIAPVSSQLINAAVLGRSTRDPRIRQQISSSIATAVCQPPPPPPPTPIAHLPTKRPSDPVPQHKTDSKYRKDRRPNQHKERSLKSAEEKSVVVTEEKKHNTRSSTRSHDKSPSSKNNLKPEKSSPKKSEEKSKKSKVEGLFSPPRSKSPIETRSITKTESPSKNHKKGQSFPSEIPLPKAPSAEQMLKKESVPIKSNSDNLQRKSVTDVSATNPNKQSQKPKLDLEKPTSVKNEVHDKSLSPESADNSTDMIDEDIENIVKNPLFIRQSKVVEIKLPEIKTEEKDFNDDSGSEINFDEIIRNPSKQPKIEKQVQNIEDQLPKINEPTNLEAVQKENSLNSINDASSIELLPKKVKSEIIDESVSNDVSFNFSENKQVDYPAAEEKSTFMTNESFKTNYNDEDLYESMETSTNNDASSVISGDHDVKLFKSENEVCIQTDSHFKKLFDFEVPLPADNVYKEKCQDNLTIAGEKNTISDENKDISLEVPVPTQQYNESNNLCDANKQAEEPMPFTENVLLSIPLPQQTDLSTFIASEKEKEAFKEQNSMKDISSASANCESMEIVQQEDSNIIVPTEEKALLSKKLEKLLDSPTNEEKKNRKAEKLSIMEEVMADAEKHESSPSPPPPPVISDKFKEVKPSTLSRLRRVGRLREDHEGSESPEPADVDLRAQIQPLPLSNDLKIADEVLGLPEKDVDLRNLPGSPSKKRPSMDNTLDTPPSKKNKPEPIDELFGSEDVDLRPVLCPPPPSPPPPPIISNSPPRENSGESLWAQYKQTKPDTYKSKYTPSRRDRGPSVDKLGRYNRLASLEGGGLKGRIRTFSEDVDMRAPPPSSADSSYNHIIMQATEQHKRGELSTESYQRVLSEVCVMNEKKQLEEAQRRDAESVHGALSDDDISGLSDVEDAPSPSSSSSGSSTEDSLKKGSSERRRSRRQERDTKPDSLGDVDIRVPPTDVDIRMKTNDPRKDGDLSLEERLLRKSRGSSPYRRRSDKEKYRSRREELRAQRRENASRRQEDGNDRHSRHRYRYEQELREPHGPIEPSEGMEVDAPRVPPLHLYEDMRGYREPLIVHPSLVEPSEQKHSPPLRPPPVWDQQRLAAPPNPWMPGMAPHLRGLPGVGVRPPDRFLTPRWQPPTLPGPFDSDPRPGLGHLPRFSRFGGPPLGGRFPRPLMPCEVPPTDPNVLKLIEEDPTTSIDIDGFWPDIRFYGHTAVAMMSWDDPIEISFRPESGARLITVDDRDSMLVHFGAPPVEMLIDGEPHRVKFGAPTRELYIDNKWYHILFGGPPVMCDIGGRLRSVQLEGPLPSVLKGAQRKDLVVGKVNLIIDAEHMTTVFLDAKPQKFEVNGLAYIIRFVEALQKTVINGVAFKSEFGGLPRPIILNGTKHYFRLTMLPPGITPGYLTIVNMEGGRLPSPPPALNLPAPPQLPASLEQVMSKPDFLQPPPFMSVPPPKLSPEPLKREQEVVSAHPPALPTPTPTTASSAPSLLPPSVPVVNPLDMLSTLTPVPEVTRAANYSYSVDSKITSAAPTQPATSAPVAGLGEINVAELLQKLMATGIVPSLAQDQGKDKAPEKPVTTDSRIIKPVDFLKPETLKTRQTSLITHLYSGIQCNSCGVRFPPEQTMKYSQHLDWHFRQNRRDKDSTRTAQSRRYYYDVNDWVQFEEIEDLEERAQPWFEMQEGGEEEEQTPRTQVSVRAADYPEEAACEICHDKFESFYNEEKEEWHLRNAVDHDSKLVHPLCLEDQKAAAEKPIVVDDIDITEDGDEPKEEVKAEEEKTEQAKKEEDDDIMEVTDIEFVNPVFPVEDLTVSDSESVADNNEQKTENELKESEEDSKMDADVSVEILEVPAHETNEESQDEGEKKEETENIEENKDESSQDNIVLSDKNEDSILSNAEIMEVVRNIKKDPDALGGEYEEGPDIKKEKGEVPVPEPVVDTTHASVVCSIDGNVEFDETPQPVGGPPKIKINITKPVFQSAPKEVKELEEIEVPDCDSPDVSMGMLATLNNQPPPPGEEPILVSQQPKSIKPRLLEVASKRKEFPMVSRDKDQSGLCSIM